MAKDKKRHIYRHMSHLNANLQRLLGDFPSIHGHEVGAFWGKASPVLPSRQVLLERNKFPYELPPGAEHWTIWSRFRGWLGSDDDRGESPANHHPQRIIVEVYPNSLET